jgi:hypothetical protein
MANNELFAELSSFEQETLSGGTYQCLATTRPPGGTPGAGGGGFLGLIQRVPVGRDQRLGFLYYPPLTGVGLTGAVGRPAGDID